MNPAENNSNLQFLKEYETEEGDAVYSVYLKKYTYNACRNSASEELGVASVNFKTKELRIIKAGTLDKLLESLFLETGEIDGTYVRIFLATFRTFCSPQKLSEKLTELYISLETSDKPKVKTFQKSVLSVLSIWLDLFHNDFDEPPSYPCLQYLLKFLMTHLPNTDLLHRVQYKFTKLCSEDDTDDGVDCGPHIESGYLTIGRHHGRRMSHDGLVEMVDFAQLNVRTIAEQLTRIDAELFMKLEGHQCLGSVWNHRGRQKTNGCPTVEATVEMFNSVIYRVISTILKDLDLKASKRVKIIEKWIMVAQELRLLKNFSSLRAIISGLQSSPIFRLRKIWTHVSKDALEVFQELASIFSLDSNQITSRELLMKEGTAKVSGNNSGTMARRKNKERGSDPLLKHGQNSLCCGTVPYLGTFLSDLTMIDSAFSDYTESGLINFEKKRKEFEIVAQISLFQSAAKMYQIEPHRRFTAWFESMRVYTEDESYSLSCEIEPPTAPEKNSHSRQSSKSDASYSSNFQFALASLGMNLSSPDGVSLDSVTSNDSAHPVTSQSSISSGDSESFSPDRKVIKVCLLKDKHADSVNYKSMMLTNKDRALAIIKRVMEKFHTELAEKEVLEYCLNQITDKGKELTFPNDANVFYAMDTSSAQPACFIVRKLTMKSPKRLTKTKSTISFTSMTS